MKDQQSDLFYDLKVYVGYIGLKISLGATGWMIALYCIFDHFISPYPISTANYVFRNAVAGFADATFVCIGDVIVSWIEKGTLKYHNFVETGKLWIAVFIVGALWYPECDLAYYISHGDAIFDNYPVFTFREVLANFFVYLCFHQLIFKAVSRLMKAAWADHILDFQVGFGAAFFYVSYAFPISDDFLASVVAGFFTGLCAAIGGAGCVFIRWIFRKKRVESNYSEVV